MRKISRYCFIICLLCVAVFAHAQTISVTPEKKAILLGEPLLVKIKITGGQQYKAMLPDSIPHFEILERSAIQSDAANGNTTSTQNLTITSFDSGRFILPSIAIEGSSVESAPLSIDVTPIPADSLKQYSDVTEITNLQPPSQAPYWLALTIGLLVSLFMIIWLNRKQPFIHIPTFGAINELPVPTSTLLQLLEQLQQQWQQQEIPPLAFGNQLMAILIKYLAARGINNRSKTGEELIVLSKGRFNNETWQNIAQTIRVCNALRFGKFNASLAEGNEAIETVRNIFTNNAN